MTTMVLWITGKSFSEALILSSTNPQYDKMLSYWGLIDAKIRASDKDLPAKEVQLHKMTTSFCHYKIMDVAKGENKTHRVDQSVEKRPKYVWHYLWTFLLGEWESRLLLAIWRPCLYRGVCYAMEEYKN